MPSDQLLGKMWPQYWSIHIISPRQLMDKKSLYFQFEAMEVRSRSLLIIKKLLWFFSSLLSSLLIHFHFVQLYLSESVKTCVVFHAALCYIYLLYIWYLIMWYTIFVQFLQNLLYNFDENEYQTYMYLWKRISRRIFCPFRAFVHSTLETLMYRESNWP